jgi:hypothetical protein
LSLRISLLIRVGLLLRVALLIRGPLLIRGALLIRVAARISSPSAHVARFHLKISNIQREIMYIYVKYIIK